MKTWLGLNAVSVSLVIVAAMGLPAAWAFDTGEKVAGVVTFSSVGSRKQVVFPQSAGSWVLRHQEESRVTVRHLRNATSPLSAKVGEYWWGEDMGGKTRSAIYVKATLGAANDGDWPRACQVSSGSEVMIAFPDETNAIEEKCVILDAGSTLTQREASMFPGWAELQTKYRPVRARFVITTRKYGVLHIVVTTLSSREASAHERFYEAFTGWARFFSEQLSEGIQHGLDDDVRYPAVPSLAVPELATVSGAVPASVMSGASRTVDAPASDADTLSLLKKLKSQREKGVISDDEYRKKVDELLAR